jgi:hypothetical protein
MKRTRAGIGLGITLVIGLAAPAGAQGPTITEVAGGLDSPRGLAVAADGTIYVAEAGVGGTDACVTNPELGEVCFGPSGAIAAISGGEVSRIVDGLPSAGTEAGEVIGAGDVTIDAAGTIWFTVGGPTLGAAAARDAEPAAAGMGQLYRIAADGTVEAVADLAAYESAENPDADQPGNEEPDSNIQGVAATADGAVVADAGGNTVLGVDGSGTISLVAVLPVVMTPMPADPTSEPDPDAEPMMVPMDPVPTGVAVGADGAVYVGQLTGFPFPVGGASVFRVVPGEEPTVHASGFTNIMDVAFGPDGSLYVLEIAHIGLLAGFAQMEESGPPMGGLWKVPAGGGDPELIASEGLVFPGGVAVADDGTVYVTTCTSCGPGTGGVVSIQP